MGVLVNFDVNRTTAAAEVLVEFANLGHQVFVFTCHPHVADIFEVLDADVRTLPQHIELAENRMADDQLAGTEQDFAMRSRHR